MEDMEAIVKQHCEVCERETEWSQDRGFSAYDWCKNCGHSKEEFEPDNYPGGCPEHPNSTHEVGYGLAGGGCGVYSVCNECNAIFDKFQDPEMM